MNDLGGLSEYLVIGVALLLLVAALALKHRYSRVPAPEPEAAAVAPRSPIDEPAVSAATAEPTALPESDSPQQSPGGAARSDRAGRQALIGCTLLAVVAVGLAAVLWDASSDLATFWLLLAVGGAFVMVARSGLAWSEQADARAAPAETLARSRAGRVAARSGLFLLGAALLIEAGALALFGIGRGMSVAWVLHLAAVGAAAAGLWRAAEPAERRLVPDWRRVDTLVIVAVVLAALVVRVWRLDTVPEGLWFDESQRGLEALRMLAEHGYRPIFAAGVLLEPTGLWYLMMPLLALLGRDPVALRLPVALAGAAGVGAIYLLARVLYGWRVALVAAGLTVTLAWHLNFSRIALPAVMSLTCDTFAAALFVAGLRRESRFLLGLAGLVCGAGLYFYFTSQLMPPVLALVAGHQIVVRRFRLPRRMVVGLVLCGAGYLLAAGPFALFALTRPEQFLARADAVSVMRDVQNAHSLEPVWANIRAHLLMFQVHGDNNGRHNWSGHPMLDPVTGGLSILGLGLALLRVWRVEQVLVLGWIPIALAGGILSSIWDAPQAHRSIDALVPAVLLAALPVSLLWRNAERLVRGVGLLRLVPTGLVIVALLLTDGANLYRFFRLQQTDEKTWTDFMAPQTEAGRQAATLPPDVRVYLEPNWVGHPSVRFVDPVPREYVPFDPASSVPVTADSAAIFIGERPGAAQRIARMYPGAARTVTVLPRTDRAFGYGFVLPPDVVQSTRGVMAQYRGVTGTVERREPTLWFEWPSGSPLAAPFSATWTGSLLVPAFASYRLRLEGPASLALTLDGVERLRGGAETSVRLARGLHALRLEGRELGSQPVRLLWAAPSEELRPVPANLLNASPVETEGLLGQVYPGQEPAGEPVQEQVDPNVDLRVHLLPAPRPYTLEWSGSLRVERDGPYRFDLSSLGPSTIWIDGAEITRKGFDAGQSEGQVELRQGWHELRIRFVDLTDFSYVTAFWQPPGADRAPIPPTVLRPWPPERVRAARPEDDALP